MCVYHIHGVLGKRYERLYAVITGKVSYSGCLLVYPVLNIPGPGHIVTGQQCGFVFNFVGKRVIEGFTSNDFSRLVFIDSEKVCYETEVFF